MSYVEKEGLYRCRLQLDNGHPCIDVIEHYPWDNENRCVDESKPLGGLQVILRADAWRVLDNGELSPTCEEIDRSRFGATIISEAKFGEEVKHAVIANFVKIFGLRDASELLAISSVNPQQLADAVFDCNVTAYTKRNGDRGLNYWFAPVGEAVFKPKAFTSPTRNKSTLEKYRSKLRVECKGIVGGATPSASAPQMAALPTKKATAPSAPSGLPPRESQDADPTLDLNKVWSMWIAANPADTQGNAFYEALSKMYGNREASTLNAYELSAFCKANIPVAYEDDDENPPF